MRQLTKRAQFLKAARGRKIVRRGFVLQAIAHNEDCDLGPALGYTVTKRVGNAPQRNRIKRRLRALSKEFAEKFDPEFNYVLIGRQEALHEPFNELKKSLARALEKIHVERSVASHAIDRKSKS